MFNDISGFVARWLPHFIADNRSYLTVAIGCTGGQHRSVFCSEKLARYLEEKYSIKVTVYHTELDKHWL